MRRPDLLRDQAIRRRSRNSPMRPRSPGNRSPAHWSAALSHGCEHAPRTAPRTGARPPPSVPRRASAPGPWPPATTRATPAPAPGPAC
ncbi:hypothetical protein WR25_13763 [Diploscapter pachys]|uniref:Uncharacterized protein n=1 Tax=Diploscapter pachys TaxID=2018661 RepID=A0A2A2M5F2_9BILA|nr:hypothetical protein WR25_13763 [Diploscapter pachys]